jgi:hypothetical protein
MPRKRVASTPPDDDSEPFEARRLRSRTIAKPKAPKPQAVAAQKRASPGKKSTVRPSRQGIDTRSRRRKYEIAQKQVGFHDDGSDVEVRLPGFFSMYLSLKGPSQAKDNVDGREFWL